MQFQFAARVPVAAAVHVEHRAVPDVYEAVRAAGAVDGGPVGVADPQAMLGRHVRSLRFDSDVRR